MENSAQTRPVVQTFCFQRLSGKKRLDSAVHRPSEPSISPTSGAPVGRDRGSAPQLGRALPCPHSSPRRPRVDGAGSNLVEGRGSTRSAKIRAAERAWLRRAAWIGVVIRQRVRGVGTRTQIGAGATARDRPPNEGGGLVARHTRLSLLARHLCAAARRIRQTCRFAWRDLSRRATGRQPDPV